MTKFLFLFTALILTASLSHADEHPQCAQTGWPCRRDPCCSILDYCNISGVCAPVNKSVPPQYSSEIDLLLRGKISLAGIASGNLNELSSIN